jgi:phenylacetate-CoA oxygenase PaaH subunit
MPRHAGAEGDGAGRAEPLVVAVADDVRPARQAESRIHTAQSMRWKIKRFTNDELRQKFVDATVPQAEVLGLTLPDPTCVERERGTGTSARSTGDEFWNVLKGNGPCNRERLGRPPQGLGDGAWVREAALAHAAKQEWPLWEVFIRSRNGLDHKHCGSVHAPDARMALQVARDVYTRRMEGVSIWVVRPIGHRRPTRTRSPSCSIRPRTRSTAIRPSTSCRTK